MRHRLPTLGFLCLLVVYISAQNVLTNQNDKKNSMAMQQPVAQVSATEPTNKKLIKIIHSGITTVVENVDYTLMQDTVTFFHEGAYLHCDSVHYYEERNVFEAFSNVSLEQGDTLFLYGDYLHYDGNTKLAKFRDNVRLEHQSGTLFTDSLNFDRVANIAYYFEGGLLVDSLNELTSYDGQYEPNKRLATFTNTVKVLNPNFILTTDKLTYNTDTKVADILSESVIESDSGTIYSSRGWYNTISEKSLLLDRSRVVNKEGNQTLIGDSILFYKLENKGEVFGDMFLQDTTKRVILTGNYGFYDGLKDYALAVDSALAIEYSQGDSLFLHADTLELMKLMPLTDTLIDTLSLHAESDTLATAELGDSLIFADSIQVDSLSLADVKTQEKAEHRIKAYHGVRFFRSDIQGVCDSLQFNSIDSTLYMYQSPVLWNLDRQLSGDTIIMFMNDSTIERMHLSHHAYVVERKDSAYFNQLKSRLLDFFFEEGKIKQLYANGNVETVIYPEEKDSTLTGVANILTSSLMKIDFLDGQFDRLMAPAQSGKSVPFHLLEDEHKYLKDFKWLDYLRPLNRYDVFRKTKRRDEDKAPVRSAIFDRVTEDDEY